MLSFWRFLLPLLPGAVFWATSLLSAQEPAPSTTYQAINQAAGLDLLQDDSLWDDTDVEIAKRLKWPRESQTDFVSSYHLYPKAEALAFGTRPYSMALYGEGGKASQISIIFTNKGDYLENTVGAPRGKDPRADEKAERMAIRDFSPILKKEEAALEALLLSVFGVPPKRETFGTGADTRELVKRWDWKGHAFLLSAPRDEYVSLRILPSAIADADGRGERVPGSELRAELKQRVKTRPNHDVIITQIPMVDQGPKGFCVPATWERYLRYLGISADMYTLAMAGNTKMGGGTSPRAMASSVSDLVRRNGRSVESVPPSLDIRNISKQIDEGIPLMWGCFVYDPLEKQLDQRMKPRAQATDMEAWGKSLASARKEASQYQLDPEAGHMRMIIGYNPVSNELAISDSWGSWAEERWITVEEAKATSQDSLTTIKW